MNKNDKRKTDRLLTKEIHREALDNEEAIFIAQMRELHPEAVKGIRQVVKVRETELLRNKKRDDLTAEQRKAVLEYASAKNFHATQVKLASEQAYLAMCRGDHQAAAPFVQEAKGHTDALEALERERDKPS